MSTLEIVLGLILLVACVVIVAVVLLQDSKDQGLNSAMGGGVSDTFYGKNESRTKEARLNRVTRTCAIAFFVIALAVNIIIPFINK